MSENEKALDSRISELEEKINYVILQITNLQLKVSDSNPELKQMMNLLQILTSTLQISKAPLTVASQTLTLKDTILQRFPDLKYDSISKAIIAALDRKKRLNISQLTEQVRKERGSASRRIVRERVDKLIESGIIAEVDSGYGRQLELIKIEKEEE
jgi:DNA-binding transcriptional ArsR family regulator